MRFRDIIAEDGDAAATTSADIATVAFPLFTRGRTRRQKFAAGRRAVGMKPTASKSYVGKGVYEGRVPKDNHRGDVDTNADIEVTGVDQAKQIFEITYNGKPLTIDVGMFMVNDFDYWQIADYEIDIIDNGKELDSDSEDWLELADTIIAYLDINRSHDIQLMAWSSYDSASQHPEGLFNDIEKFNRGDKQQIQADIVWLLKNITNAESRQEFTQYISTVARSTSTNQNPQTQAKAMMYLAFNYSREGNTEMTPGMKLPKIKLDDPDDKEELQQKVNDLLSKVKFKFDDLEGKIIEIAYEHGLNDPDQGSGFGAREMYWDQMIPVDNKISARAKKILAVHQAIDKHMRSFNNTLQKIGLPGAEYHVREGLICDQLTDQQEDYFATPEGFAKLASGQVDVAKMIQNNVKSGHTKESVQEGNKTAEAHVVDNDNVIYRLDRENPMDDTEVLMLGGAGRYSLKSLRDKARREAQQLAKELETEHGHAFRRSADNIRQLTNTLNTIVAAYNQLERMRQRGGRGSRGIRREHIEVVKECIQILESSCRSMRTKSKKTGK